MDASALSEITAALHAERARLAHEITDLERESSVTQSKTSGENAYRDHMADQGTATFGKELYMTLEGAAREMYGTVLSALARIEAGTYGTCLRCGQPVNA